ncbi:MAG: ABC transporter permease [Rhizobiaceae bacterium]|nr:ABC transporter permease [Rhizobiaceae bacterium]
MVAYVLKRLALMIPTLLGAAVLIFLALRVIPGDIVEVKLRGDGAAISEEVLQKERQRLGLDRPLIEQFGEWMGGLLRLDLGKSMWTERPVSEEIGSRLNLSLHVAVLAMIVGLVIAIPVGSLAALYPNSGLDYAIRIGTMSGLAIPSFWMGMLIILALLHWANWLPTPTFVPIWQDPVACLTLLIWPALAVGFRFSAVVARMLRSTMVEVLREDYIRTARAKGTTERRVVTRHAMPNAMLPTVTVVGIEFAFLIGGLIITEQVFNLNGLGKLFIEATSHNDFVLLQGMVMVIATVMVLTNLVVDLLYSVLNPRIRYS